MNTILVIGLVITALILAFFVAANLFLKAQRKEEEEDRGFPLPNLDKYPAPPMPKCKTPKIEREPIIDNKGYVLKMEWTQRQTYSGIESTGGFVIDEEHEITIKRRALDKMQHLGRLRQPKPVVYETVMMRVR